MTDDTGYSNDIVGRDDLPRLDDRGFEPLDPTFLRLRIVSAVVVTLVVAALAFTLAITAGTAASLLVAVAATAVTALATAARCVAVRHMGYLVREHDVSVRSGVVTRSVATVPFARVQHVAIQRGPIERSLGLASLQMRTAGGAVAIPGLRDELAGRLKQLVADRAGVLAEAEAEFGSDTA